MDIGTRLRAAREQRQLTLADIAFSTNIPLAVLEALERGDYARVPRGLFGRAHIRAFAGHVGLDADAVVTEYEAERGADAGGDALAALRDRWARRPQFGSPWPSLVLAAIGVAIVVSIALFLLARPDAPVASDSLPAVDDVRLLSSPSDSRADRRATPRS